MIALSSETEAITSPKICSRCHERPAMPNRPGPYRCAECVGLPRAQRRRRRTRPRSATIPRKNLTRAVMAVEALSDIDRAALSERPQTRAECADGPRPCPWVSCKHHLYLDINPETGSLKLNFPDLDPWELEHSCALDVAERDGITLEEVGKIMNLTRERIRQLETRGMINLGMRLREQGGQ